MASPSAHAMPEHWTELSTAIRQQQLCAGDVEAIKSSCARECKSKHVSACPGCYAKVLDRMRRRYAESEDREWFTQRKAFLHELEGMFQDAKDGAKSLKHIEARIESEKEAWYRWVLRKYPEFIAASGRDANQEELRGMLDDPDRSRSELVGMMLKGVGKPEGWPLSVEAFADKVAAAKGDATELKKLYITAFFIDPATGAALNNAQRYLDELQASDVLTLEDAIDKMVSDIKESRNAQPQREAHQRRLDELRRARTAFEQNKAQAKNRLAASNAPSAPEPLHRLPPCLACQKAVNPKSVLSCTVCHAAATMGGDTKMTVYCSNQCHAAGHGDHVRAAHRCAAGDACAQVRDEDVEMDDGTQHAVSCDTCVAERRVSLYCSRRCAAANMAAHMGKAHAGRAGGGAAARVTPLDEAVRAVLQREQPGLAMTAV